MAVAGLRDGAAVLAVPRRMLAWYQAEIGHQLAGCFEATPIDELRGEYHGGVRLNAAEAAQSANRPGEGRREGQGFDLRIEVGTPTELVLEQREELAKDDR